MKEVLLTIGAVLLALWISWGWYASATAEAVDYKVLQKEGSIEVREYPAQLIARTSAQNENAAFSILANYIFGGNKPKEKIAMTTPVETSQKIKMTAPVETRRTGRQVEIIFFFPAGYTIKNAPEPLSSQVVIEEAKPRKIVAIRFAGYVPEYKRAYKESLLRDWIEEQGIKATGEPFTLIYNDPWTPPFMRRNEVAIEIV